MLSSIKQKFLREIADYLASMNFLFYRLFDKRRSSYFSYVKKIKKERETWVSYSEVLNILLLVKNVSKIDGDIAEVGVFKGGTAKAICKVKGNKKLYLFDTFEGLPQETKTDDKKELFKGRFDVQFDEVKDYLKKEKNVYFYKGIFPSTAGPIKKNKFSFVHLDVDLYDSTKDSLEFFYNRMNKGGVIISHDYNRLSEVKKAFDEFFEDKIEPIIEISETQCLIVKV